MSEEKTLDINIGIRNTMMNRIAYSAIMDHENRFGGVFNTDRFFMKYLMIYYPKFSMDDVFDETRGWHFDFKFQNLEQPIYHTDNITYYILVLDNPYIHYKDLEYDEWINKILNQVHDRMYVIYTNESVRTYIKQNYDDVKLICSIYGHRHNYERMMELLNSDIYGVCVNLEHIDLCAHFADDKLDFSRIFIMCDDFSMCEHCEGQHRCIRWKSRHLLPVKHYVDYVTPMWEYRPKFLNCYSNMNKKESDIDMKPIILDISERFGLENFLLNQYNNGISDVIGLFTSDEWRDKILCQTKE